MQQQNSIVNEYDSTNYLRATGPIEFGITNDYMFRIIFQENKFALKGLLSSVLHIDHNSITSLDVKNTVKPGQSITDKEYRMDILIQLNDNTSIKITTVYRKLIAFQALS